MSEYELLKAQAEALRAKEKAKAREEFLAETHPTVCPHCGDQKDRPKLLIELTPGGTYWTCFKCNEISLAMAWAAGGALVLLRES